MTAPDRLERDLPRLLTELVEPPMPDDLDAVLRLTATVRQRSSWAIPGTWNPMAEFTDRLTTSQRVPIRLLALLALLVVLAIGVIAYTGSGPRRPAPFGPAANGLVIYSAEGDIFTADSATGATRAVVAGSGWDSEPRWSRDGTHFLFVRSPDRESPSARKTLYVARADGSDVSAITAEPLSGFGDPSFSPDGTKILYVSPGGLVSIAPVDGRGQIHVLTLPAAVAEAAFRPPDGSEISLLFGDQAMSLVRADGSGLRYLVPAAYGYGIGQPTWSPDGSQLAYIRWRNDADSVTARVELASPDTGQTRDLPMGPGAVWEAEPSWSNDGTRLAIARGYTGDNTDVRAAIVSVPAGGRGIETDPSLRVLESCCLAGPFEWAPDDSWILFTPTDGSGNIQQTLIDPATGQGRLTEWPTTSGPSWQRLP
jgi:Tol biopolymer transport system component